jgi:hypothetical protein
MSKFDSPLDNIRIASPCAADWDEMYGDDRKRFCGECKLNVYNLSGMTRDEAESLIIKAERRLCVRFNKRGDGTVITQDCPVGWSKVKQRTRLIAAAAGSILMAVFTGVFFVSLFSRNTRSLGEIAMPFATPTPDRNIMGGIAPPRNTNVLQAKQSAIQGEASMGVSANRPAPTKLELGKMKVIPEPRPSKRES